MPAIARLSAQPRTEVSPPDASAIITSAKLDFERIARRTGSPAAAAAAVKEVGPLDRIGTIVPFAHDSLFYGEMEPANYLYKLVSGVARGYRVTADGRRQIVAFYMPGDLFGFELGQNHSLSVEAISNTRVRLINRHAIMTISGRDEEVAQDMWASLAYELHRDQEHILCLGKTARERVAGFLWEMSKRLPNCGIVELPMSRLDIADYLGLTIETVSRMLKHLVKLSVITMSGTRKITIRDPWLLKTLTSQAA
jgi:CRP/FNR family transcriptional regulator, nitrogen fixation regulation protein